MFFFEKKNQKTFVYLRASVVSAATAQSKVFLLLFLQKKKILPLLPRQFTRAEEPGR
jgi:hypothetical protein